VTYRSDKSEGQTAGTETVDWLACPTCHSAMRIVAFITPSSVIDQKFTHLRTRASPAAPAEPTPTPRPRTGTFGVGVGPTIASDSASEALSFPGSRCAETHEARPRGEAHAAGRQPAFPLSAIAPDIHRILDRPRSSFLSRLGKFLNSKTHRDRTSLFATDALRAIAGVLVRQVSQGCGHQIVMRGFRCG